MLGFVVRRVLASVLVVILTSIFVFVLFFKGLGDSPARNYCEQLKQGRCSVQKLDSIKHQMGYDRSVATNYRQWAVGLFVGRKNVYMDGKLYDCPAPCLGISSTTDDQVWKDLEQKFPATLTLSVGSALTYLTLGVVLGALAARVRGTLTDRLLVGWTLVISAVPDYLIILLAWLYFTLRLGWFPNTGYVSPFVNPFDTVRGMLLPWLVMGFTGCSGYARFTRGQMVETLTEDYVRTAQAKGLRNRKVLFKHALRAAIVPVVTIFGLDFAFLLSGTIFAERIFGIDGIGNWSLSALSSPMDLQVLSASVLLSTVLIVVANLIVDVIYGFLDPRVVVT